MSRQSLIKLNWMDENDRKNKKGIVCLLQPKYGQKREPILPEGEVGRNEYAKFITAGIAGIYAWGDWRKPVGEPRSIYGFSLDAIHYIFR